MYSFPYLEPSVPCPVLTVASWPPYRFLKKQVRWPGIPVSLRIFQFAVIPTVKQPCLTTKLWAMPWMWLVIEVKFDAVKSNIAWEPPFCGLENNAFIDKQVHTTCYNLLICSDKYAIPSIFVWCKTAWWGYSRLDYGAILVLVCHMFGFM